MFLDVLNNDLFEENPAPSKHSKKLQLKKTLQLIAGLLKITTTKIGQIIKTLVDENTISFPSIFNNVFSKAIDFKFHF